MTMTPGLRKFALTTHVTSSVGWLGAVGAFLALAIAGLVSQDAQIVRAAYLAMHLTTWFVIVPLCLAALLTGIVQSLGTTWGLFRHYWIVTKLLLTVLATIILLVHTQPIDRVAGVAAQTTLAAGDLRQLRIQLVGDACAALFVLLVTNDALRIQTVGHDTVRSPHAKRGARRVAPSIGSTAPTLGPVRAARDHRHGPARSPLASCRYRAARSLSAP